VVQVRISPDPGPAAAQDTVAGSWEHRFVAALASKDTPALLSMFAAEIDFRAMTPGRVWEARTGEQAVTDVMLGMWFAPDDVIEQVETIESGLVGHRRRLGYRLVVANPGGRFVVEQQAYLEITDGKITWLRLVCSGFVPLTSGGPGSEAAS
jgi:hypothetical protein